jgi:hypothetical protein
VRGSSRRLASWRSSGTRRRAGVRHLRGRGRRPAVPGRAQDPAQPSLYTNLGAALSAQGLYGPAAAAFERALVMGGAATIT